MSAKEESKGDSLRYPVAVSALYTQALARSKSSKGRGLDSFDRHGVGDSAARRPTGARPSAIGACVNHTCLPRPRTFLTRKKMHLNG